MRAAVVLIMLLSAGCAGTVPVAEAPTCAESSCQAVVDEAVPGIDLRGVVVDETITPLAGVRVDLMVFAGESLATVVTDKEGAFLFSNVPEGFYELKAQGEGLVGSKVQTDVSQGMRVLRIMMAHAPSQDPMHLLLTFDGLMGCSWRVPFGWVQLCSLLGGILGDPFDDDSAVSFWDELTAPAMHPDMVQLEMTWESSQALGDALTMMVDANVQGSYYGTSIATVEGNDPLVYRADNATILEHGIGAPDSEGTVRGIGVQVWSGTQEYPVGMTYQQPFEMFLTASYGFVPAEEWMFTSDGEPVY